KILRERFGEERVKGLPLGVKRVSDHFVTWSTVDTILGGFHKAGRFQLEAETILTKVLWGNPVFAQDTPPNYPGPYEVIGAHLKNLIDDRTMYAKAQHYAIACGAVGTPQILYNTGIRPWALGRFLTEQSLALCQIVLKPSIVQRIADEHPTECKRHASANPCDLLPIPGGDPEPQLTMPYWWSDNPAEPDKCKPRHAQIHRDAFSYGDVGPRADLCVVVDLRVFGKQDIRCDNRVSFPLDETYEITVEPGKDAYGMPQATFHVKRSEQESIRDHE
ncbi:Pyranose 2-oxidase, partial [Ceratobasidium sp. 370]